MKGAKGAKGRTKPKSRYGDRNTNNNTRFKPKGKDGEKGKGEKGKG
jgi:hypothetical protein